jgi:acetolactate synthase regulatory subunit
MTQGHHRGRSQDAAAGTSKLLAVLAELRQRGYSAKAMAEAQRRYEAIEPLLKPRPRKFRWIWMCERTRPRVIRMLAGQYGCSERSIYRWLRLFRRRGFRGLLTRCRLDRGRPRIIGLDALRLIALQASRGKSIRAIHRAYMEQAAAAQWPPISYDTVRVWRWEIPEVLLRLARRNGREFEEGMSIWWASLTDARWAEKHAA